MILQYINFIFLLLILLSIGYFFYRKKKESSADKILNIILESYGNILSFHQAPKQLLDIVLEAALKIIESEQGSLLLLDENRDVLKIFSAIGLSKDIIDNTEIPVGEGISGWVAKYKEPLFIENIEKDVKFAKVSHSRYFNKSLVCFPIKKGDKLLGVLNINNKKGKTKFNKKDIQVLEKIAYYAASVIEKFQLFKEIEVKKQLEEEIDLAKEVQKFLMPKEDITSDYLKFGYYNYASFSLGGDYIEILKRKSGMMFIIGDISWHGIASSIHIAMIKGFTNYFLDEKYGLSDIVKEINKIMYNQFPTDRFITFQILYIFPDGCYKIVNCGHMHPIIFSSANERKQVIELKGCALGFKKDIDVFEYTGELEKNESILLYSDGLEELADQLNEKDIFSKIINHISENEPMGINSAIKQYFDNNIYNKVKIADDVSFIYIKYTG